MNRKAHISTALEKYQIIQPYLEGETPLPKLAEIHDVGLRSLRRWVKTYREKGLAGLERKPHVGKGKRKTIDDVLEKVIEALVLEKPPLTYAAIHRKVKSIAQKKGWKEPTYVVVRDIAQSLDKRLIVLAHEGSKAYGQIYDLIYRRESDAPNEMWQADHTPLDILLIDEKGNARKPWLTVIIDDYSRAICGFFLSFDAPCALHVALALRQAIWRKSNPKWQVCGIPEILYTDNGSDFRSKHIEQVAADLKIRLVHSIPDKPRGRGRVERFFLTVIQTFLMNLSGYAPAGHVASAEATLTLTEFTSLFEKFILEEYHQKIHSITGEQPVKRWLNKGFLPRLAQSLEQLDLLLLTVVRPRKVHRDGIRFQTLCYIDTTLAAYVGEDVTIRYDPRDLAEIRVFFQDKFLCRAICNELADKTVSLKDIIRARQRQKRELKNTITERKSLLDSILENAPAKKTIPKAEKSKTKPKKRHSLKLYRND